MIYRKAVILTCALLTVAVLAQAAAGLAGRWQYIRTAPDGSADTFVFTFDVHGDSFTGTVSKPNGSKFEMLEGKISGETLSFKFRREDDSVATVNGKIDGDELRVTIKNPDGNSSDIKLSRITKN